MTSNVQVVNCSGKSLARYIDAAKGLGLDFEANSRITPDVCEGDVVSIRDKVRQICQEISVGSFVAVPTDSAFVSDLLTTFLLPRGCTLLYVVVRRGTNDLQGVKETAMSQWWHGQGGMCLLRWGKNGAEIDVYRWGEQMDPPKSVRGLSDFAVGMIEELAKQERMRNRVRMDEVRRAMLTAKLQQLMEGRDGVYVQTILGDAELADEMFDLIDVARDMGWFAKDIRKSLARDSVTALIVSPGANFEAFTGAVGRIQEEGEDGTPKFCSVGLCGEDAWEIVTEHPGAWIGYGGSGIKRLRSVLGKNIRVKVK